MLFRSYGSCQNKSGKQSTRFGEYTALVVCAFQPPPEAPKRGPPILPLRGAAAHLLQEEPRKWAPFCPLPGSTFLGSGPFLLCLVQAELFRPEVCSSPVENFHHYPSSLLTTPWVWDLIPTCRRPATSRPPAHSPWQLDSSFLPASP